MPLPGDPPTLPVARPRIVALDVVRGFALSGIPLVNARLIAAEGGRLAPEDVPADPAWLSLLAQQRFSVIFALLFGVGFALLVDSSATRSARPRLALLRRLAALLVIGLVHRYALWGGDILTVYALVGLVVLLPSTWLPRWAVAVAGGAAVVAAVLLGGGGPLMVAGLFLAGAALVRYGVVARAERSALAPAVVGAVLAVLAVPALWWQVATDDATARATAGLLMAGVYVCALLVLLRTPARAVLTAVFAPLGRMALTNYLGATVAVLAVVAVVGHPERWSTKVVLTIVAVVLLGQWVLSALWLRWFRQGPVEWVWRWATWGRRPAFRR